MTGLHKPNWISSTLDAGNLITIGLLLVGAVTAWNQMQSNQASLKSWQDDRDKTYAERRASTDARFSSIETKIQPIDSMLYRLGKQESETAATNQRVDRVVDAFSDQLKELRKDVNSVGTKVEVLVQTINDQNRRRDAENKSLLSRPQD